VDRAPRWYLVERPRRYWDRRRREFYLDRHRPSFQAVLYYYQSGGRLRRPIEVPDDVFLEELEFYEISDSAVVDYKVKEGFIMEKVTTPQYSCIGCIRSLNYLTPLTTSPDIGA